MIGAIAELQATIAAAVEEQTSTTQEMSRSIAHAATGSTEIAGNITGVATGSQTTTESVTQSQQAVPELARMSSELSALVARFRY